jgi:hypothetical protein
MQTLRDLKVDLREWLADKTACRKSLWYAPKETHVAGEKTLAIPRMYSVCDCFIVVTKT